MFKFSFVCRPLSLCMALAIPALQAQQSPASPAAPNVAVSETGEAQCILAGRLNSQGRWAPAASGVQLLDAAGKRVPQRVGNAAQPALSGVKAVRLAEPALLSKCNAGQAMGDGDASTGSKSPAPAVTAGKAPIQVQAMVTLPGRAGGQWVELRVSVPSERVVMLMR